MHQAFFHRISRKETHELNSWEELRQSTPKSLLNSATNQFVVRTMQRAILLQTEGTTSKNKILQEFSTKAIELANLLLKKRTSKRLMDLHRAMYSTCKKLTSFNSQVICDIERAVIKTKCNALKRITVKFNIPRNCKTFNTKTNFFVELGIYPRKRIAIPIRQNRNYQRYTALIQNGWQCKTYGLTTDGQIVAYLSKESDPTTKRNMLGVDVNSKCFAVSILTPEGKVLKQLYFGKDIWIKRKKIMERRSLLQSFSDKGSHKATQKLLKLKVSERNFVKNRVGEIVRDITNLALQYQADIGIEKLERFKPKGRRFNKEVLRIPFYLFKTNLANRCFDKSIKLHVVDAYHTSKWCSHCGAVGKGHSPNYALYKCGCGQIVNSDRKASLAIAVKSLLVRNVHSSNQTAFFQLTNRKVPVNGLFRSDDGFGFRAVHDKSIPMESQRLKSLVVYAPPIQTPSFFPLGWRVFRTGRPQKADGASSRRGRSLTANISAASPQHEKGGARANV